MFISGFGWHLVKNFLNYAYRFVTMRFTRRRQSFHLRWWIAISSVNLVFLLPTTTSLSLRSSFPCRQNMLSRVQRHLMLPTPPSCWNNCPTCSAFMSRCTIQNSKPLFYAIKMCNVKNLFVRFLSAFVRRLGSDQKANREMCYLFILLSMLHSLGLGMLLKF